MDERSLHYSDFMTISETMLAGYARFLKLGVPGNTIALAMLGGTVNLYDIFGLRADLPELLRSIADRLEHDAETN